MMRIDTLEQLRARYPAPKERAVKKQLAVLDRHCKNYIALSPFVVLSSLGIDGQLDASPRGGAPGFVKALDSTQLLIPDSPGNNRLDTLENIIHTGRIGLLFVIPGVDETLRVNGTAYLSIDPTDIAHCTTEVRAPKLVIRVSVQQAYLHCAKAFMRSKLWDLSSQVDRACLPTMVDMINEQAAIEGVFETHEEIMLRYKNEL
ncbi:MSMEG_1061 family FMN-dependent PPOX-type flavoprotein [Zwartia sp.]|uniref:MSMEG_1061 family FMN-dependent PPOX-type flavoprotein n=1 Tax=Zwartia sp. TaxID=2978004 RepID=UPI002723481A|nr:MSMEG_1061 family FMN-dependent PPOX-type flavoprotein [Zwartia sp.]MDO9024283.1 pyridoxamine 5'-phosphate oxidase family protein [Zwartia sp.]